MVHGSLATPFGPLTLFADADGLVSLAWEGQPCGLLSPLLLRAIEELDAYFEGTLTRFSMALKPAGSQFQRRVWQRLVAIPYAATVTYGALARELATAPRALAGACARNPLPIFIPCHRVIAADGSLGGYSGAGGTATKAALLALERRHAAQPASTKDLDR